MAHPFTRAASPRRPSVTMLCALAGWIASPAAIGAADPLPGTVEFNRDIRPILSDTCFQCHGPDEAKRKADLRLDTEQAVLADLGGYQAIVPGDPAQSELFKRITAESPDERMPPPDSGRTLTERQIELLRRWIDQGAKWEKHWSFIPPQRPTPPPLPPSAAALPGGWVQNAIDSFVLARLEREGLLPSPEADKTTLVRRVTLDLTGLPPTPAEVDAFLADESPAAYDELVDRLLASPRYGERMATRWLDGARYADTNGYQSDGERFMWRWRDWVIDAFNRNMPFDQFTVEQLAGDLLLNPTLDQRIATGFNRNHRGNAEGGVIPEEYAVEYVVDRVDTTATVWLGLTMGCARCHDHKFDPLTQKEFYQLFAFFNNVPERGKAVKYGNSPPIVKAPTPRQEAELAELERQLAAAEHNLAQLAPELAAAQAQWETSLATGQPIDWTLSHGLVAHYDLDADTTNQADGTQGGKFLDGEPAFRTGQIGSAAEFDGRRYVDAGNVADFGFYDKFSCAAWIRPEGNQGGAVLSRMTDSAMEDGYYLYLEAGKLQVNLVKRWLDDAIRVETDRSFLPDCWYHVTMTYDGSRVAEGVKLYVDGQPEKLNVLVDELNQTFTTTEPLRIGGGGGPEGRFHGSIDDVRVYKGVLSAEEVEVVAAADTITDIAAIAPDRRSARQARKIQAYFLDSHAPQPLQQAKRRVGELGRQKEQLVESIPTTMVMEETQTPRDTFLLVRGAYDMPGEKVTPGVPASLSPWPDGAASNRLGLARWLADPSHPLTARVAVNRYWQAYFGTGLVKSLEDFGSQGERPSHPDLLDWLATELVRTGWDVKALEKTIVTSATYRQSSKATPQLVARDPENRLLARGPRFRLSAEMIRDQALAASGLLVERLGGPSVKPYQPAGLWKELTGTDDYAEDKGEALYRRSLYTFWKRTVAPPSMMTFDAAARETCIVREMRTNTPLQALTLLNDVTYVEASRVLAQRVMTEAPATPEERITLAFRLVMARRPAPAELDILLAGFHEHLTQYQSDPKAALELASAGQSPRKANLDVSQLAAYTAVAGLIFNLDETVTKE